MQTPEIREPQSPTFLVTRMALSEKTNPLVNHEVSFKCPLWGSDSGEWNTAKETLGLCETPGSADPENTWNCC